MRVGVIDIGSNSVRGLFGDILSESLFKYMGANLIATRLGEGLSKRGLLRLDAMRRTVGGVERILQLLRKRGVEEVYAFATSAVRESGNADLFLNLLLKKTGLSVDVLSGEEEAFMNLLGVETGMDIKDNYLLFDIGGGSTEIVVKRGGEVVLKSYPIGALKIRERFGGKIDEACVFLDAYWKEEAQPLKILAQGITSFVGIGGTLSALVLLKEGAKIYDIKLVHGKSIDIIWLYEKLRELKALSIEDLRKMLPFDLDRAYILREGCALLFSLMSFFYACEVRVSETDLLWGALVKRWNVGRFEF